MCVEEIKNQLQAERHLFQLRTIVAALRNCRYFPYWASPRTVANWPGKIWALDKPFRVAYATTCVGPKEESDNTKEEMAKLRCEFIKTLTAHRQQTVAIIVATVQTGAGIALNSSLGG